MKIAVIGTRGFPQIQGGIESHCEHLYPHLAARGCNVTVMTRKPYVKYKKSEYKGVQLIPLNCPRSKFLEAIIHTLKGVLKARKLNRDILHIHGIGPSLFAPFARILGMKVVVTHHGPDYMRKKWPLPAKIFLKFCERIGIVSANEVIAISKNIGDDLYGKYKRVATILPNGIDVSELKENEEATLIKFDLRRRRYVLAVGRFVPEKGFHDLIEAFNDEAFNDYRLVIAGNADHEDSYSRNLKAMAKRHHNIVLTGFLTEQPLRELYSNAAIFVLPSYFEGLPIALLEAMSYGLSCVASDIPANRNVPLDGNRYFKPGHVDAMRAIIIKFINDKWDQEDQKKQINLIHELYNWQKIAEDTLRVYKKVVS